MTGPGMDGSACLTFTTTQVGKICGVSQQAVIKWVDSGRLQGYRLPDSHARRVTRDSLLKFMHKNRLPEDILNDKGKLKVLVVEDEDTVADMVELVFEDQQGVEVKKVGRGFDAGVVSDYRPDVVILDIMLPDMDGRRVCELIRSGKGGQDVHIIGVSGYLDSEDIKEALGNGFDEFIRKPFLPERIRDAVMACAPNADSV